MHSVYDMVRVKIDEIILLVSYNIYLNWPLYLRFYWDEIYFSTRQRNTNKYRSRIVGTYIFRIPRMDVSERPTAVVGRNNYLTLWKMYSFTLGLDMKYYKILWKTLKPYKICLTCLCNMPYASGGFFSLLPIIDVGRI